jgi:hypothetical protein
MGEALEMKPEKIEKKLFQLYGLDNQQKNRFCWWTESTEEYENLLKHDREEDVREHLSPSADQRINSALREKMEPEKSIPGRMSIPRMVLAIAGSLAILAVIIIPWAMTPQTRLIATGTITVDGVSFSGSKTISPETFIEVPSGSQVHIERKGSFSIVAGSFSTITYRAISSRKLEFALMRGDASFSIRKEFGDVRVTTINAGIKVTGTCFEVHVDPEEESTAVTLKDGCVHVWSIVSNSFVKVMQPGETVIVRGAHPPRIILEGKPLTVKVISCDSPVRQNVHSKSNTRERVYLRNGNIIVGKIISQKNGQIILRTSYADLTYENSDVEKIEYIP